MQCTLHTAYFFEVIMNAFHYPDNELYCEEVPVAKLAKQHGTPLWIYSENKFLHEYRELAAAFSECDPVICYSVKANSNLSILKSLNEAGCSFDVVSGGELYRVGKAGADTTRVVFAGVGKTDSEIHDALAQNILMFNVESEAELDAISAVAGQMQVIAPVALRLNPDIDAKTHHKTTTGKKGNKFGMDIERHNALAAKVLADPHLQLRGIHMHLGSPILTTEPYEKAAQKAVDVIAELRKKGHEINWINLGGGFGLSYRNEEAPAYSEYAKVIIPYIKQAKCRLALEPGRSIIGNAGVLISEVIFTKREGGKLFIIQDGAMNDLVRPAMYDAFHKLWPVSTPHPVPHDPEAKTIPDCETCDVVGPVCESCDYFAKDRALPALKRGDLLCTFSTGAYGSVMSSNYNSRPRGAEVLVSGSDVQLVRKKETYDDLVAFEIDYLK